MPPAADDAASRSPGEIGRQVEDLFRREWGSLVAAVARLVRDLDRAEEIVQDTLTAALDRWPLGGVPERPGAWLMTAARNRAFDHLRRQRRIDTKEAAIAYDIEAGHAQRPDDEDRDPHGLADDRLRLIFTCCHPALARESQVALTLRLVAGLTTAEIARAFLSAEATVAQRLVRAKRLIRERDLPYGVPSAPELPARMVPVLAVLYLVFNEGYTAGAGDTLLRPDLCEEGLRLAGLVADLMPAEAEVLGLVSLMELQASRAAARADDNGAMVLLPDQDRTRWDRDRIERGLRHLARADALGRPGPYQLQAAIAACHARAGSWDATDWRRIAALYAALQAMAPSPVVELNRAVAVSMAEGPAAALELLDRLDAPALSQYHLLPATRADFLRRLGRRQEAAAEYRRALALTANRVEQGFLRGRIAECEGQEA